MVNPDTIASRDYYSKVDDETLKDSPETHKPAVSGGKYGWSDDHIEKDSKTEKEESKTITESPETHKPTVSGGRFGWSGDHDSDSGSRRTSGSRRKSKTSIESSEARKPSVSKPSTETDETLTESPEVHKAVSKPEAEEKKSVKKEVPVYSTVDLTKPMILQLENPLKGQITYTAIQLEQKGAETENPLERAIIDVELAGLGFASGLYNLGEGLSYALKSMASKPFSVETYVNIGTGLFEWMKSVPERIYRGFTESPFWAGEVAGEIVGGEILGEGIGRGISKGAKAIKGTTETKIWYHDVVPEEGSPLSFESLPKSEIAKTGGAKIEISPKGEGELSIFGEIKEVKPFTAKEVGGIIKTKSIFETKETMFVSRGSGTVSITKESPSIVGKVLGKEEKITVSKTKIVDTKPKIKENVRYFREEEGSLIEKPQFEREGIAKGGLTKELIEQKETITRVPKEFTEVGKSVDFGVPIFVPTIKPISTSPVEKPKPTSKDVTKPVSKEIERSRPKTDIIPKAEPQVIEQTLNDVITSTGGLTLTKTVTKQTAKETTKQTPKEILKLRVKTPTITEIIPQKPKKPKIPKLRGKPSIFRISKKKKGKVETGFRLNIFASPEEVMKGLGIFKKGKKKKK